MLLHLRLHVRTYLSQRGEGEERISNILAPHIPELYFFRLYMYELVSYGYMYTYLRACSEGVKLWQKEELCMELFIQSLTLRNIFDECRCCHLVDP